MSLEDREHELRRELARLAQDAQRRYLEQAQPLIDALAKIENLKAPRPVILSEHLKGNLQALLQDVRSEIKPHLETEGITADNVEQWYKRTR